MVILPPEDVSAEIDKWRQIYDSHHKMVPPHITLAFPFMPEHKWFQKRTAIADYLRTFHTFGITLKELKEFTGSPLVLWLKPEDSGSVVRIHTALEEKFPDYFIDAEFTFTPHLTIGSFDSEAKLFQAKSKITEELKPVYFQVSALVYMVLGDDKVWRHRDRIYF